MSLNQWNCFVPNLSSNYCEILTDNSQMYVYLHFRFCTDTIMITDILQITRHAYHTNFILVFCPFDNGQSAQNTIIKPYTYFRYWNRISLTQYNFLPSDLQLAETNINIQLIIDLSQNRILQSSRWCLHTMSSTYFFILD